eukprot:c364_g1_i1 orf=985-1146(+)
MVSFVRLPTKDFNIIRIYNSLQLSSRQQQGVQTLCSDLPCSNHPTMVSIEFLD